MSDAEQASRLKRLQQQLAELPADLRARLDARGFDERRLMAWSTQAGIDRDTRNRLGGTVEPPDPGDLHDAPKSGSPQSKAGAIALREGQVAFCVLAGGMATRMGGVVKALVEALPGRTFLDLRIAEQQALQRKFGRAVPLWLMVSEATAGPIQQTLTRLSAEHVATFEQCVSLRLTNDGDLFRTQDEKPSVYPTGHGDLPEALVRSGLLRDFVASGGKYVWIANLDNLGATIDEAILGEHIASGAKLSVELVDKLGADRGGGPVRHNGRPIVCEEFRLPLSFDASRVTVFNTNTFIADAAALHALDFEFTFVEVEKTVEGAKALQFERLLGEITVPLLPHFIRVPRAGTHSRFLPVKDSAELSLRRPEIEAILRDRGILV